MARFPLDYTCCVDQLSFSWIDGNISLAQQLYSVFYEWQKMIGYLFREELLQIVILFPIGNHIFRHVATSVSACKLRLSKKNISLYSFYCIMLLELSTRFSNLLIRLITNISHSFKIFSFVPPIMV